MTQQRERYHFIHNVFGNFYKDVLDWIKIIYPRFEYSVIGTYDKSVEYLNKRNQYERETDKPMLPALILNPSGEFSPADGNAGGKQFWRYPNLSPTFAKRLFDPIYSDENILIYPGFLRIKGEIELIMLLNSFYEYCDLRLLFINYFGGLERIIYPQYFSSFIVLPESFVNYEYYNEYTNERYMIDWDSAGATNKLVKTTAQNELVLPLNIKPQFSLQNLSDASNRYGGADNIAEWKLQASLNYEIEIPNYIVMESDYLATRMDLEIRYESIFAQNNDYQPPSNRSLVSYVKNDSGDKLSTVDEREYVFKIRYFHIVTDEEASDSTSDLIITLPESINERKKIIINSCDIELTYGDHYTLSGENDELNIVTIYKDNVDVSSGGIFELYIYEDVT